MSLPDATLHQNMEGSATSVVSFAVAAVLFGTFEQFVGDPAFARIENAIKNGETIE